MRNWGLLFFLLGINAFAGHTVIVVDSPFNSQYFSSDHSKIANKEYRTMSGLLFSELNKRRNEAFQKGRKFHVDTNSAVDKDFYQAYIDKKNELEAYITHSSQTSSVLADHLNNDGQFVVFPIIKYKPREYGRKDIKELIEAYQNGKLDQSQESEIEELTNLIKQTEARVVQMSFSTSYSIVKSYYESRYNIGGAFTGKKKKNALYQVMTQNSINYFKSLFSKSPNTLFLLSAGNQSKNTEKIKMHLSQYPFKNTLYIGAVNKKGHRRVFSNYSNKLISIGLEDSDYDLLNYNKKTKALEGTSFTVAKAAALFSNLAHSESINDIEELKARFIDSHCTLTNLDFQFSCK